MTDPFNFRVTDRDNPKRKNDFEKTLAKRGADPATILRKLIDAYVDCDGLVSFPAILREAPGDYGKKKVR